MKHVLDWLKDGPPDSWTPKREQKATLLAHVGGDLEKAVAEWTRYTRSEFARFMVRTGRTSDG